MPENISTSPAAVKEIFSEAAVRKAKEIISRYPEGKQKSALLPLLHLAQEECEGWLSVDTMDYVAQLLHIEPIEVYEVATFYSMFKTDPTGKYVLQVCQTGPCLLCGAGEIMDYLCSKLGVKPGETTADGMFTVEGVECLGACGYAPLLQLGDSYREHLTKEKIDKLLTDCREMKETQVHGPGESEHAEKEFNAKWAQLNDNHPNS